MPPRFEYDTLTAPAFRQKLDRLGMDGHAFARLTGTGPRTVQRWLAGDDIPHWVSVMLALLELPQSLGTARMITADMIRRDRANPSAGQYPFAKGRDFPDDGPDWID